MRVMYVLCYIPVRKALSCHSLLTIVLGLDKGMYVLWYIPVRKALSCHSLLTINLLSSDSLPSTITRSVLRPAR